MKTTFHVYDDKDSPVEDLINLDEDQLINKIKERVHNHEDKELTIVKVIEDEYSDASY
tara:strand:+ start:660 stop:833 length:174 start_codon:yes stop_codon:yes gene_type:complete